MPLSVDTFRVFIRQLAARPGMWVGAPPSIDKYAAAIAGYQAALVDAGVEQDEFMLGPQFHRWLATESGNSPMDPWVVQIRERFGDEAGIAEAARLIEQWFRLRDERS